MKRVCIFLAAIVGIFGGAAADTLPNRIDQSFFSFDDRNAFKQQATALREFCQESNAEGRRDCMDACFMVLRLMSRGGREQDVERAMKCAGAYNGVQDQTGMLKTPETVSNETPAPSAPAPVVQKMSDPAAELCRTRQQVNQLFDCTCLDENAPAARNALVEQDWLNKTEKMLPDRQNQIKVARERLETEEDPQRRAAFIVGIERTEAEIAELEVRVDPASFATAKVIQQISDMKVCRIGDVLEKQKIQSCESTASSLSGIDDAASYCACMGKDLAEAWTSGAIANYSSKAALTHNSAANLRCRG